LNFPWLQGNSLIHGGTLAIVFEGSKWRLNFFMIGLKLGIKGNVSHF